MTLTTEVRRPASLAEARAAVLEPAGPLLFRGAGTKLAWGGPVPAGATVVETSGLSAVLTHNAADGTASVQAGVPLADFQARLAEHDQWLAIDPPHVAEGATIGGILAANDAGPRRLRYGAMRDLVIGLTVVLSDGTVARSGGHVIKNVAGYDLPKLLCGSLGTLGLIAEVVVRLHPLPEASATLTVEADPATATGIVVDLLSSPVVASAADWADGVLWVRVEGHPRAVADQLETVRRLAADHGAGRADRVEGEEERAAWSRLTATHTGAEDQTVARAATLPDRFPAAATVLDQAAGRAGVEAELASHVGLGLHTARLRGGDARAHAAAVEAWRHRVGELGGHVVVRRHLPGVEDHADVWGPPPAGLALMRRVKEQLDPGGRCAPGRFVGGL